MPGSGGPTRVNRLSLMTICSRVTAPHTVPTSSVIQKPQAKIVPRPLPSFDQMPGRAAPRPEDVAESVMAVDEAEERRAISDPPVHVTAAGSGHLPATRCLRQAS